MQKGRKRVVITNISPQVNNGQYTPRWVVDDPIRITADIFCDGHDELAASIFIKHQGERQWKEFAMKPIGNDRWEVSLELTKEGLYQFKLSAWVDHFTTWKKGLLKKADAGQDIAVEKEIGALMIKAAAANRKDKDALLEKLEQLNEASAAAIAEDEKLATLMRRNRDKELDVNSDQVYNLEAERKKAAFSSWYELFPRSASEEPGSHGTFADVKKLLPRIAEMGFDVLYLPPVHPIGSSKRKGRNNSLIATENDPGSPWAIGNTDGGHKALHASLGTLKDFQSLAKEAKKKDIEIAMDIAFQCSPDHPYVKEHPQWFKWRPDGTVQYAENPPKRYEDILPFDFETDDWKALWDELKSIFEYWISKGISIFRVDNPHTKSLAFWEWCIGSIRETNPEVIFLAEAFTRPRIMEQLAKGGFNQSYTYFSWRNTKQEIEAYMKELAHTEKRFYFRPNFWPNTPDILPPLLHQGGENAHIMRLVLAATLSSNYGLYGPVYEFNIAEPMPGKEEYTDNEKYEIKHWDWNRYTRTGEIITRVNRIRRENPALHSTWNITFAETDNEQVICYVKWNADFTNIIIVVVNLDPHNTQQATVKLPMPKMNMAYDARFRVHDLLSGDKYTWGEYNFVELRPYEMPAHIFKTELL